MAFGGPHRGDPLSRLRANGSPAVHTSPAVLVTKHRLSIQSFVGSEGCGRVPCAAAKRHRRCRYHTYESKFRRLPSLSEPRAGLSAVMENASTPGWKLAIVKAIAETIFPAFPEDAELARQAGKEGLARMMATSASSMDFVVTAVSARRLQRGARSWLDSYVLEPPTASLSVAGSIGA